VSGSIPAGVSLFFINIKSFRSHFGPGVDSPSNRNEYQEYFLGGGGGEGGRCIRLTILPPSCAVVMESGNLNFLEPSGPFQACNETALRLPLPLPLEERAYCIFMVSGKAHFQNLQYNLNRMKKLHIFGHRGLRRRYVVARLLEFRVQMPAGWGGTAVAQWLRCCATNRKVAGSIPASVSGFFIDIKFLRSHYGPRVDSTSNRNEYQEYFLGIKAAGA